MVFGDHSEDRYEKEIQRMPLSKEFHKEFQKLKAETGKTMIELSKEFARDPEAFYDENIRPLQDSSDEDDGESRGLGGKLFG